MPVQQDTETIYLSVVVPVYNEEGNIEELHAELARSLSLLRKTYEIIYVDDGSGDGSFDKLAAIQSSDPSVCVIKFKRNFGQGSALSAGFERARGNVIIPLDADMQNDPADIPKLIEKIEEGYDVVAGWRRDRQDPYFSRVLPSQIANWIISKVTGVRIHDHGCTIKAYRASALEGISFYSEMHRFILLPAMAVWQGAKLCEEIVNHRPRTRGTSKYGILKTFKVILDLLTVKFVSGYGSRPIYIFGFLAMILMFGAIGSGTATIVRKVLWGHAMVQSPLLLLTVLLIVLSALFLSMGLLAELLSRLHQESSRRPSYVIDKEIKNQR